MNNVDNIDEYDIILYCIILYYIILFVIHVCHQQATRQDYWLKSFQLDKSHRDRKGWLMKSAFLISDFLQLKVTIFSIYMWI